MAAQGFTEWEILEEHTDIYIASEREIELQKEYGLPVDTVPYYTSVRTLTQARLYRTKETIDKSIATRKVGKGWHARKTTTKNKISKTLRFFTEEEEAEIASKYIPYKYGHGDIAKEYGIHWRTSQEIIKRHKKRVSN
jgi:hypothetical protein